MATKTVTWVKRWNDVVASEPDLPGVWRRKDGGFRIRGRVVDPKTGALREIKRALPDCIRARDAAAILAAEIARVRAGVPDTRANTFPDFADWGAEVFARKVKGGAIKSAGGRAKWEQVLRSHLIPAFGPILIDKLTREDVERWKSTVLLAPQSRTKNMLREVALKDGCYAPNTVNTILAVLRQITSEASREFNFRDIGADVDNVDNRGHRTFTYEEPNSVKPADVPRFLEEIRVKFPEHYAFVFLGFTTGLRPSSLRPLRWRGPNADVKWDDGKMLVRRSHTRKQEVMNVTKTGVDIVLDLDPEQVSTMRWHLDRLAHENELRRKRSPHVAEVQAASDLLFPAAPTRWGAGGGFQSRSCLDEAFKTVGATLKLGYHVSPKAMRRTFQDLARAASIGDIVTRAISGHATETMQRHYSTVAPAEVRAGMARVIDIATGRERNAA